MKRLAFLVILLGCAYTQNAQNTETNSDQRPHNNLNLNLLGDASIFSLNYERIFNHVSLRN